MEKTGEGGKNIPTFDVQVTANWRPVGCGWVLLVIKVYCLYLLTGTIFCINQEDYKLEFIGGSIREQMLDPVVNKFSD